MDCAPNVNIFRELQVVHDTGYLPLSSRSHISPEEDWQQVYLTEFAVQVLLRKLEPNPTSIVTPICFKIDSNELKMDEKSEKSFNLI